MKLNQIMLENFRGIGKLSIRLDPELTVIVGRNGAGKTSILDAAGDLLVLANQALRSPSWQTAPSQNGHALQESSPQGEYALQIEHNPEERCPPGRLFSTSAGQPTHDVRQGSEESHIALELSCPEYGFPTVLAEHQLNSRGRLTQSVKYSGEYEKIEDIDLSEQTPLIYYRQGKGFRNHHVSEDNSGLGCPDKASLSGDLSALKDLDAWWDELSAQEGRYAVSSGNIQHRDPQLQAIRKLVAGMDSFKQIHFDSTAEPRGLYFEKSDGSKIHVDHLSSGERSFIILLADLARRLQMIAPDKVLEDIPGIVLIDEIELNLHPAWQAEIISTLRRIFKSCQFVITTHSSKVLSEVNSKNVRSLYWDENKGEIVVETPLNTKGRSCNYLLEGVFRTPERSESVRKLMREFNDAIDDEDAGKAKALLGAILKTFEDEGEDEPIEMIALKSRLKRLEAAA